jgi:hypothetical protein
MGREGFTRIAALLGTLWLAAGCGASGVGTGQGRANLTDGAPTHEAIDRGPTSYEGDVGGLSEEDVDARFVALKPAIDTCLFAGTVRNETFGGRFVVSLRIDRAGGVRHAHLSESTLGDREAERCVLDVVRSATWPKPLSGEGLASKSFEVEPATQPAELRAERFGVAVRAAAQRALQCSDRGFVATAYVGPGGTVASAGVATRDPESEADADCVVEAIRSVRFGGGRARIGKVVFALPAAKTRAHAASGARAGRL